MHANEYASKLIICNAIFSSVSCDNNDNIDNYRTDLDTHTKIVVLRKNYYIARDIGRIAEVQPFSLECEALQKVLIIDAIVQHNN